MISEARILIVEDSPTQAAIIAEIVRQSGHIPIVYTELPTGISQILNREQPELVLLDLRLIGADGKPIADGFQICREIKRISNSPPVVVVSAEGDDAACEWAILQGADAFLQKPFVANDLTQIMSQLLQS